MRQIMFADSITGPHRARNGVATSVIIIGLAVVILGGLFAWAFLGGGSKEAAFDPIVAEVSQGEFVSQVLDQGEIQSSDNVEIRCEVESRNGQVSVLKVVAEGTQVKGGDFLVELDSTQFEKELEQQNIAMANARTQVIQAETALASARATLNEYTEGIYVEAKQSIKNEIYDAESQIATAKSELQQSEAVYENSDKLHAKGFITSRQLEADDLAVSRAKISVRKAMNSLKLAEQKQVVLKDITRPKNEVELKANIEAAIVKFDSEKESYKVEEGKLADVKVMIEKCTVVVPPGVAGQVVYAKESSRRGDEWVLEEGANVRESQVLVRLPDPSKMEVKALINEQSITQIAPNMPVSIKVDALNDTTLKGVVTKVSQYAESSGWMSTTVRKYAVNVRIIDPPLSLKPGMNASCAIQTRFEKDAVMTPLQTIYGVQDRQFCLVKNGDAWETRELILGGDNSQVALVKEGLKEGDQVVMNPGAYKSRMDLPELELDSRIEIPESEMNQETAKVADGPSSGGAAAGGGRPGGKGGRPSGAGGGRPSGSQASGGGRPSGAGGGRPSGGGGGFGGGGMPSTSTMVDAMMKRSDTNSDGKIDAGELASMDSRMKSRVEASDANGDGEISKEEMKAGVEKMMKSWGGGGGGGGRPGGSPAPAGDATGSTGSAN